MKNVLSVMFAMVLASSVGADELCREGATLTYTMVDAYQRGVAQERMLAVFDNGTLPPALAEEFKTAVRELYLSGLPRHVPEAQRHRAATMLSTVFYSACTAE